MAIPKIIHYCWFGGAQLPDFEKRCVESWQFFCKDFEIRRWDETNAIGYVEENLYAKQAYEAGMWAFVSDYVRLKVLHDYGGVYVDTDVEMKKSIEAFLVHPVFLGFESSDRIATCVIGSEPQNCLIGEIIDLYRNISFVDCNGNFDRMTNVERITAFLLRKGLDTNNKKQLVSDAVIYPSDYFSPKSLETGAIKVTDNTRCIHHFKASWMTPTQKRNTKIAQLIGPFWTKQIKRIRKYERKRKN